MRLRWLRPFPELNLAGREVVVIDRSYSFGFGGVLATSVRSRIKREVYSVIAGLGGRDITKASLHAYLDKAVVDEVEDTTFLDLDRELVDAELARENTHRHSGAIPENMLRDLAAREN